MAEPPSPSYSESFREPSRDQLAQIFGAPRTTSPAYATITLSVDTMAGLSWGRARELVFQYTGSPELMSELIWPLEGLAFWGSRLTLTYGKIANSGFYSHFSVRFGLTQQTGTMTDKDWMGSNGDGTYFLTHFSAHNAISEHSQWLDIALGYGLPLTETLVLRTSVEAAIMNLHWTARDGYTQYGPNGSNTTDFTSWSPTFPKEPIYGTGIGYWQSWVSVAPALDLLWVPTSPFTIRGGAAIFVLNACSDQDDHYLRLLQFTETMSGGFGFDLRCSIVYRFRRDLALGFETLWRSIIGLRGNTTIMEIGNGSTSGPYRDTSGADYSVIHGALYLSYRLL
ncbi:MAG: omptin family outer membrane protease [Termitinemataceae bacterium]